jgi:hypothetical protein
VARKDSHVLKATTYCYEDSMFIDDIKAMEVPERTIPSLVRFECLNQSLGVGAYALYFSRLLASQSSLLLRIRNSVLILGVWPFASTSCQIR